MRPDTFRLTSTGSAHARRLLVLIFAVAGILLGLVAMHSLDLGSSGTSASSHSHEEAESQHPQSVPSAEFTLAAAPTHIAGVEDCAGMCAMKCLALGMACAMALLTITSLLGRRAADSWMMLPQQPAAVARALPRLLPLPPPPSLTALSISRT